MDVGMMETEVMLSDFIEFFKSASEQVNQTAPEADRVTEEQLGQTVTTLNIMKTLFVTQKTVQRMIEDAGGQQ